MMQVMIVMSVQRITYKTIALPLEKASVSIRVIQKYVLSVLYYPFVPKAKITKKKSRDMYGKRILNFVKRLVTKKK